MGAERRLTIGLTGGIGSGKSAAADELARLGAAVIDADRIAHELTAPGGAAIEPIRAAFGDAVIGPDGALDRARMRAAVFADAAQRRLLEAILHPAIAQELHARATATPGPYVVWVVPLLVENLPRWRPQVDRIAVIDCPEALQVERVMRRSNLAREQVQAILAAQARRSIRLEAADDVVENAGSLDDLLRKIRELNARYLQLAGGI